MRTSRMAYGPNARQTFLNLKNLIVNSHREKCDYDKFYGEIPDYEKYLKTFI